MYKRLLYILVVSLFLLVQKTQAQNISNEGTDFWAVFPTHVPSEGSLAEMAIFISSKSNSSGKLSVGGTEYNFKVMADQITQVNVPRAAAYIDDFNAGKVLSNKGIHIVVDPGMPKVAVYAHIYARARSEAYLVLPIESLGKKYFAISQMGGGAPSTVNGSLTGRPFLVVVATENNTTISVKTPSSLVPEIINLPKKGDVYEVLTGEDLTGTSIEIDNATSSCKTFAVYSGHSGISLSGTSYDPLLQQLYPIASWGKVYGVVPFAQRRSFYKVIAAENGTTVRANGLIVATLNAGQSYLSEDKSEFEMVSADKPISVAQFTYSQDNIAAPGTLASLGDPDMVILNPVEYSIKNITVFSSDLEAIQRKYINVFMKTKFKESLRINGAIPSESWNFATDKNYSYIQIEVSEQSLTLTASDGFNAIAYGFGDHESYAYSAGTNLASSLFLLLQNKVTNTETSTACLGQASDFKLTMPYLLSKIIWKLDDGTVIYTDENPNPTQNIVNGQTLYTYFAPVNQTLNAIGIFNYSATVTIPQNAGSCLTGDLDLNFEIEVDPIPVADFTAVISGCADEEIAFTDKSDSKVKSKPINRWLWDFGDGETSTDQNPKHVYSKGGKYTLKLMAGVDGGCLSDAVPKEIEIKPKVTALFSSPTTGCLNTDFQLTDQSKIELGKIDKWYWDMGDGKPVLEKTTAAPFNYKYAQLGNYTITLVVQSDQGCKSLPFSLPVEILGLPTTAFSLPDACVSDAESVFINTSKDLDGSTAGLTYEWDFGDPASGALNKSTEKDGKHDFNAPGIYKVKLTVKNVNGCTEGAKIQDFTVNGSSPIAKFELVGGQNLCSNQTFEVLNQAYVADFGDITRIEWYIDGVLYSEDENPMLGKKYSFTYPAFTAPLTKSIQLKMLAFSGNVTGPCNNATELTVILKASPVVQFNALAPICLNGGNTKLAATEIGGLPGNGVFTGTGVSTDGTFDPLKAGVGIHEITYTFTADNGCSDFKKQNIEVYSLPEIDAGRDQYILIGGEKAMEARATGNGLSYKWSPAIGLSQDDILNPIVKPEKDMIYTLTVTSKDGCSVSDQVNVYLLSKFEAPNSFTPNDDGINDVWNIKYLESYPKVTVEIFNRNGQKVYSTRGYKMPFDGNYKNEALPVGTYYYIINPNSDAKIITGNLTIIR